MKLKLAYLNTEYPSLSHTFIEREIRCLRRQGFKIQPFSVRSSNEQGRMSTAHQEAAEETIVLQSSIWKILLDFLLGGLQSPLGILRALLASQRLSPPGIAHRLWHIAYFLQSIRLVRMMRPRGISHVHVHMANNGAAIAILACEYDRRLTYSLSIHGSAEFFQVKTWTLQDKAEKAIFVRCISNFCRAQVMAWTNPKSWSSFHVVHCGIDTNVYQARTTSRTGPLRILTVGRLHPIKGYDVLLDACQQLRSEGIEFELQMVGDGSMMESLLSRIKAYNLDDCVFLRGAVGQDQIGTYYDHADVMIVSSFMEGVPVVLMEAMAKKLAVVATRVGGIPELVEDGVSGFLVDPGSCESLVEGIKKYASNLELCRIHGEQGRRIVCEQFTIEKNSANLASLFYRYTSPPSMYQHSGPPHNHSI